MAKVVGHSAPLATILRPSTIRTTDALPGHAWGGNGARNVRESRLHFAEQAAVMRLLWSAAVHVVVGVVLYEMVTGIAEMWTGPTCHRL